MGRTLLFEGEPDHLVPAASEALIESNLFRVAGRMLGHTFLHDGPHVTGLSPAVIHVLFNGDPEMATVVTEDCPDLHIRSIIELLEHEDLTPEQKDTVSDLSMSWDLPELTQVQCLLKTLTHCAVVDFFFFHLLKSNCSAPSVLTVQHSC
ncbi:hypothetical protein J4Q44_G00149560 [Coregonus suidteri]|uniref:Uncharacterized protein n=1 Tax=Coregonus suidteri TaxID=861788 RepID=A0AAN8R6L1_9TELE